VWDWDSGNWEFGAHGLIPRKIFRVHQQWFMSLIDFLISVLWFERSEAVVPLFESWLCIFGSLLFVAAVDCAGDVVGST
jgi:hypothetical protein